MRASSPDRAPAALRILGRTGWLVFLGWWALLALLFAWQMHVYTGFGEVLLSRPELLLAGAIESGLWALVAIAAFWLADRYPLEGRRARVLAGAFLTVGLALVVGRTALQMVLSSVLLPQLGVEFSLLWLFADLPMKLLLYLLMLGVGYTLAYFHRARRRQLRLAQLEAHLAATELEVLTARLRPEFLFATLRMIAGLVHQDRLAAERVVARLADLLRTMLQNRDRRELSLHEELQTLRLYLEIERLRLDGKLQVEWEIGADVRNAAVPYMLLQSLVEGQLHTASAGADAAVRLRVTARRDAGTLRIEARRSAPDPATAAMDRAAELGGSTRIRLPLARFYGEAVRIEEIGSAGELGVRVELPYRDAPDDELLEPGGHAAAPVQVPA
jgi:two-component system, LytTR family, sensor kinase